MIKMKYWNKHVFIMLGLMVVMGIVGGVVIPFVVHRVTDSVQENIADANRYYGASAETCKKQLELHPEYEADVRARLVPDSMTVTAELTPEQPSEEEAVTLTLQAAYDAPVELGREAFAELDALAQTLQREPLQLFRDTIFAERTVAVTYVNPDGTPLVTLLCTAQGCTIQANNTINP